MSKHRKASLVSVLTSKPKPKAGTKTKRKGKKTTTKRVAGITLSMDQVAIVDDAIHMLAKLAVRPPTNQKEMETAINELGQNHLALTAFRTYLDV